jgi:hypothetical protein
MSVLNPKDLERVEGNIKEVKVLLEKLMSLLSK